MLLGTSLIYCISDLLDGTKKKDDVFAIVSSDTFDLSNEDEILYWYQTSIIQHTISQNPKNKLSNYDEHEVINLFVELVKKGVIVARSHASTHHVLGLEMSAMGKHWYSIGLIPDEMIPAVKEAYDYYKAVEGLCKK